MLVPNAVWTLVELFLIIYILYVVQRIVMNAQTMARQEKAQKMLKAYTKIFSGAVLTGLTKALGDLTKDESKKEKPKKDEEDSDDDIDLDDLLS
ncbi:MAG: hypothetical protein J6U54_24385 [Clostridiales bacterium]|nr:hypothetical protein [Clostridiales bacterium]